jgi:hypothetical protein
MQRVRKFLIVNDQRSLDGRLPKSALVDSIQCDGWHQSWDTAVRLLENAIEGGNEFNVAIADESVSLQVIAIFSLHNLESIDQVGTDKTKWRSIRISAGSDGCWCNLNYSDYGWGWVSGAKREVPFRLRYFERQAEANPNSLVSRTRAWILEFREWVSGHGKKIG